MKEDQKYIYYACGDSIEKIEKLPQTELVAEKGCEILYFTDEVDEFAIQMLAEFEGKSFKSVSAGDLDIETEEEKSDIAMKQEENQVMLDYLRDSLGGKVIAVRLISSIPLRLGKSE